MLRSPLDLDHATMRRLGHLVADTVAAHLSTLRQQPAYATLDTAAAARLVDAGAPAQGTDFETLLATLRDNVFHARRARAASGFIAYVPTVRLSRRARRLAGDGIQLFAGCGPVAAGPTSSSSSCSSGSANG